MIEDNDGERTDLRLSNELVAKMADGVCLIRARDDAILYANPSFEKMFGYDAGEVIGKNVATLNAATSKTPDEVAQEIGAELTRNGLWRGEILNSRKDGSTFWSSVVVSTLDHPFFGKVWISIQQDISARRRYEEQLRNLTERLSLATRTSSIGIWDLDLRTDGLVWDDTTFEIFDIPKVPMTREEFRRWVHPDDLSAVQAAAQHAIQGKTRESVEFRIIRPDGSIRYVSTAEGAVLDEQGNVVRLVGTIIDITERKEMEIKIEASARLSALGMMAGGVAHEINNPLAVIHTSAEDFLNRMKSQGSVPLDIALRHCERVLETSKRISNIIKSMRHLSREGSHDKVRATPVSKIVEETLATCEERFKHHGVRLLLNVDPTLSVCCREVQIGQVLLNLLQNAFDSVAKQPKERWVSLAALVRDDAVELSVTDSGAAIPPNLKTKIMDPFFTTKDVGKGTGLGLSISRRIVEDHGGKLELKEENGHPCFSFRLPLSSHDEPYAA